MAQNSGLGKVGDWIFRISAMRDARALAVKPSDAVERAIQQVRLLIEVARRVIEPADALPVGSRPAVLLSLYRQAAVWMLAAYSTGGAGGSDLAALWDATPPEKLVKAAGDAEGLAAVRAILVSETQVADLKTSDADVERARGFVEALLWDFDAPNRLVDRVHLQRWIRIAGIAVVIVVIGLGARSILIGPNLAAGKPFKTSSAYPECTAPNKCADLLFHTQPQDNPWVDFDLGTEQSVHRIDVTNRSDCCAERTVPLIAEISLDDKAWTEVARRDAQFSTWTAEFAPRKARFVRLRVPRNTTFHLDAVAVR